MPLGVGKRLCRCGAGAGELSVPGQRRAVPRGEVQGPRDVARARARHRHRGLLHLYSTVQYSTVQYSTV